MEPETIFFLCMHTARVYTGVMSQQLEHALRSSIIILCLFRLHGNRTKTPTPRRLVRIGSARSSSDYFEKSGRWESRLYTGTDCCKCPPSQRLTSGTRPYARISQPSDRTTAWSGRIPSVPKTSASTRVRVSRNSGDFCQEHVYEASLAPRYSFEG